MAGMTWERLEQHDSLTYPLTREDDPGEPIIFRDGIFPTDDGKGRFVRPSISRQQNCPMTTIPLSS